MRVSDCCGLSVSRGVADVDRVNALERDEQRGVAAGGTAGPGDRDGARFGPARTWAVAPVWDVTLAMLVLPDE